MARRVVVTGLGLVTPLGVGVEVTWDKLVRGCSGVSHIDRFDVSDIDCKIGGGVPSKENSPDCGFEVTDWVTPGDAKKMDVFIHYGISAAVQAIEDSGFVSSSGFIPDRAGVVLGSGIGGLPLIERMALVLAERGPRRVSPFFIPASLINLLSGHVSIRYGLSGPNDAVVTACATGAQALCDSARIIKTGEADIMVAGSAESALCRLGLAGFCALRALSTKFNDSPQEASRPWDKDRDGFVMGEGAGVVVLEEYEHAKKRGAKIYAELLGYGATGDAYHITSPDPSGSGGIKTMEIALQRAGVTPSDIGYINAHGTSTLAGDFVEAKAIKYVFGNHAKDLAVSSTKSSIGHLLGGAGSVESIFSILAMNHGVVPPTLNLHNPSEGCDLNFVPMYAQDKKVNYALSNSFGFGGANVSLIFGNV